MFNLGLSSSYVFSDTYFSSLFGISKVCALALAGGSPMPLLWPWLLALNGPLPLEHGALPN